MSVAEDYPLLSQLPDIGTYESSREALAHEANALLLECARLRTDNRRLATRGASPEPAEALEPRARVQEEEPPPWVDEILRRLENLKAQISERPTAAAVEALVEPEPTPKPKKPAARKKKA